MTMAEEIGSAANSFVDVSLEMVKGLCQQR